jgi:cytochrome c
LRAAGVDFGFKVPKYECHEQLRNFNTPYWRSSGVLLRLFWSRLMDYRILGSALGAVLFVVAAHISSQFIYAAPAPSKASYVVPGLPAQAEAAAAAPTAAETAPDFATVLPMADAMAGEAIAERCGACHDWSKGGPNKIGPSLYGVVGRPKASHPGFDYSAAMKGKGGNWTYADLFNFLRQPAAFAPGTKMSFAGLPRAQERLNVIAFLRMQADTPAPLR